MKIIFFLISLFPLISIEQCAKNEFILNNIKYKIIPTSGSGTNSCGLNAIFAHDAKLFKRVFLGNFSELINYTDNSNEYMVSDYYFEIMDENISMFEKHEKMRNLIPSLILSDCPKISLNNANDQESLLYEWVFNVYQYIDNYSKNFAQTSQDKRNMNLVRNIIFQHIKKNINKKITYLYGQEIRNNSLLFFLHEHVIPGLLNEYLNALSSLIPNDPNYNENVKQVNMNHLGKIIDKISSECQRSTAFENQFLYLIAHMYGISLKLILKTKQNNTTQYIVDQNYIFGNNSDQIIEKTILWSSDHYETLQKTN